MTDDHEGRAVVVVGNGRTAAVAAIESAHGLPAEPSAPVTVRKGVSVDIDAWLRDVSVSLPAGRTGNRAARRGASQAPTSGRATPSTTDARTRRARRRRAKAARRKNRGR